MATAIGEHVSMDHLSWSSIQTYSMCGRRFAFRYMEQAPEERRSAALPFGNCVHQAAEILHEARLEGRPLPGVEALMEAFDRAWNETKSSGPVLVYGAREDEAGMRRMAEGMLSAYHAYVAQAQATVVGIEHAARFRLLADTPPIEARMDLLELDGSDLVVSDLKTSRSSWNEAKARENTPQLIAYSIAALPLMLALGAKRIVPRFIVVTKGKRPQVQEIDVHASRNDVDGFKDSVRETWKAIQSGVFLKREGWQCASCPFRDRCKGGER